jgi:hypothetical protein
MAAARMLHKEDIPHPSGVARAVRNARRGAPGGRIESPSLFLYIGEMELNPATDSLLSELESFSGGKIKRRPDLGILLEYGRTAPDRVILDELGFYAKFLHRTYGIMTRIGRDGNGYERLAHGFSEAVEKTRTLISSLLAGAPGDVRERFATTYLSLSHEGLDDLLSLCHDLSWYKNWLIDTKQERKART